MNLLGKRYTYIKNDQRRQDSTFKHVAKTVVGLGLTTAVAYGSYKYGYSTMSYLFEQIGTISDSLQNPSKIYDIFVMAGLGSMAGLLSGGLVESMIGGEKFSVTNWLKFASIVPAVGVGTVLYHEPHWTELLLGTAHMSLNFVGAVTLAVASTAGMATPLFSKQIMDRMEKKIRNSWAFYDLIDKFNHFFEDRKNQKELKQNRKIMSQKMSQNNESLPTNQTSNEDVNLVMEVNKKHHSISNIIFQAEQRYQLRSHANYTLNMINQRATYIVENAGLENIAYRHEVLSLYGTILPQIALSYEASLENSNLDEQRKNAGKLAQSLDKINEHFTLLENVVKEAKKNQKNMDFDEALQFADSRFQLTRKEEEPVKSAQTLKMNH